METNTIKSFLTFIKTEKLPLFEYYALINKRLYHVFQTGIILLAALTPVFAVAINVEDSVSHWLAIISSSCLAIFEGTSRLFRFEGIWLRYRDAINKINREIRLYENSINEYGSSNKDELFIQKVENLLNEEEMKWIIGVQEVQK